jgi:hypothetical protein
MHRFPRRPSPAMAVAFVALLAALSGTAVALPGKNTVDSGDIKKGAVKRGDIGRNAVNGGKIANNAVGGADVRNNGLTGDDVNEGTLGAVPNATNANSANSANSANTAGNSQQLGGVPAANYKTANAVLQSGVTLSGIYAGANTTGSFITYGIEFDPRLPADIDPANAHRMAIGATSAECPGQGQAAQGHFCLYEVAAVNATPAGAFFQPSSGSAQGVDDIGTLVFWNATAATSRVWGTWAVTAP